MSKREKATKVKSYTGILNEPMPLPKLLINHFMSGLLQVATRQHKRCLRAEARSSLPISPPCTASHLLGDARKAPA